MVKVFEGETIESNGNEAKWNEPVLLPKGALLVLGMPRLPSLD